MADVPVGSFGFAIGPFARALSDFAEMRGYGFLQALDLVACTDLRVQAEQSAVIKWIRKYDWGNSDLRGLDSLASHDAFALEAHLARFGVTGHFSGLAKGQIGVVSTFLAPMGWRVTAKPVTLERMESGMAASYRAFRLPASTCARQALSGAPFTDRVTAQASDGSSVMLAMLPDGAEGPQDTASLLQLADRLVNAYGTPVSTPGGVILPWVSFNSATWLPGLQGLAVSTPSVEHVVAQACQYMHLSMNETGQLRRLSFDDDLESYTVDQHCVAVVMQFEVPVAAFYLAPDCWVKPLALV